MNDATEILSRIESGDPSAVEQLLPLVYDELRRLAAQRLVREKPGQTLQPTALVHEAYIRLVDTEKARHWDSRGHFFAAAARAMRQILVDNARRKRRPKHGGDRRRVEMDDAIAAADVPSDDILALDAALEKLAAQDTKLADLVNLKYFGGLTLDEVARAIGISPRQADRSWAYAKAWLQREIRGR